MRKEEPMKTKNLRRGATLTELMVVIAVIAIVVVMVVSFSAMVSGGREMAQAKLDALQDIRLAETIIESFIEDNANNPDKVIVVDQEVLSAKYKENEEKVDTVKLNGNFLTVVYDPDEGKSSIVLELQSVTGIKFADHGTDDKIYYCTITYNVGGTNNESYTFCVNPYAGEN